MKSGSSGSNSWKECTRIVVGVIGVIFVALAIFLMWLGVEANYNPELNLLDLHKKAAYTCIIIGVAPAGAEISTRPFQLVTGRSWRGTAFGGASGRTDVPKIVDWYMQGKIEIDPMITHTMGLEDINKGFDLMHEGKSIRAVVEF